MPQDNYGNVGDVVPDNVTGKPTPQTSQDNYGGVGDVVPDNLTTKGTPTIGQPQSYDRGAGYLEAVKAGIKGIPSALVGAGKAMAQDFGNARPSYLVGGGMDIAKPTIGPNEPILQPHGTAEKVGYGGGTLLDFLMTDNALSGLSLADKAAHAAKTLKIVEKSPKLMQALVEGAAKVTAKATQAGAVQAGQTLERTGNAGEAAKQGLEMAGTAGVLGTAGEVATGIGGKLAKGAEASKNLKTGAQQFGNKASTADLAQDYVEKSKQELHQSYENTVNDLLDRAKGTTLDPVKDVTAYPAGKPAMAQKAEELLKNPIPSDHPLVSDVKSMTGEKLDAPVKRLLQRVSTGYDDPAEFDAWKKQQDALKTGQLKEVEGKVYKANEYDKWNEAKGNALEGETRQAPTSEPLLEEPKKLPEYDLDQLIKLRQSIREAAVGNYEPGNINSRTLNQMLYGIDDTIDQLASKTGDPKILSDYRAERDNYRGKINIYDTPVIRNIRAGNYDDAAKKLMQGDTSGVKTENMRKILGNERMDDFARHTFSNVLQTASDAHGNVNPANLLAIWKKIPDEAKENVFGKIADHSDIDALLKDASVARNIQYLTRVGVLTPLAIGGGQLTHLGLLGLILSGAGEGVAAGAIPQVRTVLDYVANHPNTWSILKGTGKALTSPAAATAGRAAIGATGQALSGANQQLDQAKKNVFAGAEALVK